MTKEERARTLRLKGDLHVSTDSQIVVDAPVLEEEGDIMIVVTQAFCPNGHSLVTEGNPEFDGHPGLRLRVKSGDLEGLITLSPIHGDARKQADVEFPAGTQVEVGCPICGTDLPVFGDCVAGDGGKLRAIYLTRKLVKGYAALVCDIWGCHYSKVVDDWDLLSEVVLQETAELD